MPSNNDMTQTIFRKSPRAALLLLFLFLLVPCAGNAASLPVLGAQQDSKTAKADTGKLATSLDTVISTLENDDKRAALIKQLKQLRQSANADATQDKRQSRLFGSVSAALSGTIRQVEHNGPPMQIWRKNLRRARADFRQLLASLPAGGLLRYALTTAFFLSIWVLLLVAAGIASRRLFIRRAWPLMLPPEPRPRLLLAHISRRVLPLLLLFILLLVWVRLLHHAMAPAVTLLVIAYVTLCGRLLSCIFESVISLFTRHHRATAVAILRKRALLPLFMIGALIAFGDAITSQQLAQAIGAALSDWLSVLANLLAALLSGWLILRIRRPIKHLICNRSLASRRNRNSLLEPLFALGRLWHIPALLLVGASVIVIVVTAGDAYLAFARAIICAVLLIVALIVNGMIRRQSDRAARHLSKHQYAGRMRSLGYTLARGATWFVFAELSARTLGFSLFDLGGRDAVSSGLGHLAVSIALNIVVAWLVWIVTDTAIHHLLHRRHTGNKRAHINRAQTITPMIRNLALAFIILVTAISILATLGVDPAPLLAGAGVVGLALGFGAQSLISDLITGIFILIEDSLAVGDFVEINGYMGTVEGLNLRVVRMRDLDGILHITTFSHITSIHNMSRNFGIALMKVRIPYNFPIDDAIALMHHTAADLQRDPFIRSLIRSPLEMQGIHEFDDGCPILRMRFRTTPEYQWNVSRAFNLALKRRMEAEHIHLGAPRLSISMEPGGGAHFDKANKKSGDGSKIDQPAASSPQEPAP